MGYKVERKWRRFFLDRGRSKPAWKRCRTFRPGLVAHRVGNDRVETAAGFSSVKMVDEVVSIVFLALSPVLNSLHSGSILKRWEIKNIAVQHQVCDVEPGSGGWAIAKKDLAPGQVSNCFFYFSYLIVNWHNGMWSKYLSFSFRPDCSVGVPLGLWSW